MSKDIAKIGGMCDIAAVTATSQAKALTNSGSLYLLLENKGSNDCFVNSGTSTISIVFPTTSTGQNGTYLTAGGPPQLFKKNNTTDTHLACICDTGNTTTLIIRTTEAM